MNPELNEAMNKDLGINNPNLASTFYITPIIKGIEHAISHLNSWVSPRPVKTSLLVGNGTSRVVPEPYGTVLVIGSWNYPLFTALAPAAEALAAGNCVALKPSELSPCVSNLMVKLFEKYLDSRFYRVIEGGLEVAK